MAGIQDTDGGFFSDTDADSQGKEGVFFVWSIDKLNTIFNQQKLAQFKQWFDLSSNTDFERVILFALKIPIMSTQKTTKQLMPY